MTSRDQIYVLETIKAMKKRIARDAIESDSDSEIQAPTNRGNKLKQKAKFVREGKLGPPTGPSVYKEEVEHAGYRRSIISRNPPLVDEDGYDIDSDDDEERVQDAIAVAAESDPYSTIRLEQLLAPLTSVTELPTHPTLSRPFTSTALNALANQGCDLMHKENAALSKVRPLLAKLTGDHTWANCEMFLGPNDSEYFDDQYMTRMLKRRKIEMRSGQEHTTSIIQTNGTGVGSDSTNGKPNHATNGIRSSDTESKTADEDTRMADRTSDTHSGEGQAESSAAAAPPVLSQSEIGSAAREAQPLTNGDPGQSEPTNGDVEQHKTLTTKGKEPETRPEPGDGDVVMADAAGSRVNGGTNPTSKTSDKEAASLLAALADEAFIHPIFLAPKSAHPDRDLGLPEQEAEDVRRLLQLYVQKQEEVCRGTKRLYEGLLRADRQRKTVLSWAKAEAHCGPNRDMSDGEDWYDQEEWGLTEDLKKGQDEEEEDTTQTQKKTRNRNK
ncbi:hypothetical protein N0V93_002497 [Gnomoniopsis smithogilvyi]|uniref:Transcriptional regulatory protein RXT2 N-terminal domain-containing protein n=1 Tax=Gnomoniopsis smithogilvyi TaxID=1191159 RepID=A0A9W8YUW2_9PEZI|nr:hypothetical protein N0V93_002497 [Gnomoniopsis smithogilvyi]